MSRILIVLQYYHEERDQALAWAKLVVRLGNPGKEADILVSTRFDTVPDKEIVDTLAQAFSVFTHQGRRKAKGWPHGCNEMWFDTIAHIKEWTKQGRYHYDVIATLEADSCPLVPNWIQRLLMAWDGRGMGVTMAGYESAIPGPWPHINGNCLVSGELSHLTWLAETICGANASQGWDYCHARKFYQRGAQAIPEILSLWQFKGVIDDYVIDQWVQQGAALFHGCKTQALFNCIWKRTVE